MQATRVRVVPILEWLCAAAIIAALLTAGLTALREASSVRALTPVMAREAVAPAPDLPPVLASRAVSVPMLILADGKEVRVGDGASRILERLGPFAQVGVDTVEREGVRDRITRLYSYAGTQFALVLQAPKKGAELRVMAIYRQ